MKSTQMKNRPSAGCRHPSGRPAALLICAFAVVFLLCFSFPSPARASHKNVLILHSYHRGLSWTDDIDQGIRSVLNTDAPHMDIRTEYMDSKHLFDAAYLEQLREIYAYKFRRQRFDVILCSDNNALNFLLRTRDSLFPGVPVVFCGINSFQPSLLKGHQGCTGTTEAVDIRETLDLALRLHPGTRFVVTYGDASPTYFLNRSILEQVMPAHSSLTFLFKDNFTTEAIRADVPNLPPESIVLLMSTLRDAQGNLISFEDSARLVSEAAPVPVYGFWDFFLGHGIVGGKLVNGFSQGTAAAEMALRVLHGTHVASIPIVMESPNRYMFDYRQLARFHVPLSALPPESVVMHRPDSLYARYRRVFQGIAVSILMLLVVIVMLSINIRHRKRSQAALRIAEEKYRSLIDNSFHGISLLQGIPPRFVFVNPAMTEIFGYSPEEILSFSPDEIWQMTHPEDREMVSGRLNRRLKGEGTPPPSRYAFRIVRKDGTIRWVEVSASRLEGFDLPTTQALYVDITERVTAEKALREKEAKFRYLFDMSPQAISLTELETGRILDVNDEYCRSAGYSREELTAQTVTDIGLFSVAERNLMLRKLQAEGEIRGKEYVFTVSGGRKVSGIMFAREIDLDSTRCLLSLFIDMTEQHRIQREREELRRQLDRSRKMEALGLLAGGVAHDLNNILSGIVSYPELLLMNENLPERDRKAIRTIRDAGLRAAAVVNDMLTVTRGVACSKEPLNLNELIKDYLASPEFRDMEKRYPHVSIITDLDRNLFPVSGSDIHLRKTLMNLMLNAAEAIPDGGGQVTVSTRNRYVDQPLRGYDRVQTGEYVVLSVRDNGSGISTEDMERIFEPFYTRKVMGRSGTGLGLAVVWNTVQDHSGYIDVFSGSGGTTFDLYFPVTRQEITQQIRPPEYADALRGSGEHILVVDDEESQREIACALLSTLGYTVTVAAGGEEAIDYLKNRQVDLLLLDMIMGRGLNGRETYERILEIHPGQKAIIASGFSETKEVKKALQLGAGFYIRKPYTLDKIAGAIRQTLSGESEAGTEDPVNGPQGVGDIV